MTTSGSPPARPPDDDPVARALAILKNPQSSPHERYLAFAVIDRSYRRLLTTHLQRKHRCSLDDAEDGASEVLVRIWPRISDIKDVAHLVRYLFRIAENWGIDRGRKQSQPLDDLPEDHDPTALAAPKDQQPENAVCHGAFLAAIKEVTEQLSEDDQLLFCLVVEEGYRYEDAAERMNLKVNTAKWRVHRARQKILEILREQGWWGNQDGL